MRYVCKNPPGGGGTKPLSAHRLILIPLESKANIIDLIGIFARPHPYFWTFHTQKILALVRL